MAEHDARYMRPCGHFIDGKGTCGATPTREFLPGVRCRDHTPAALAGRPENRPDPALSIEGRRKAAGAKTPAPPPPVSASRLVDDRAVASGKRRSSPGQYREARAREEHRKAAVR